MNSYLNSFSVNIALASAPETSPVRIGTGHLPGPKGGHFRLGSINETMMEPTNLCFEWCLEGTSANTPQDFKTTNHKDA